MKLPEINQSQWHGTPHQSAEDQADDTRDQNPGVPQRFWIIREERLEA
jgi:hypothetical protein